MTSFEWDGQFDRLKTHFHLSGDVDAAKLGLDWYEALKHHHVDAVERGITDVIRNARETYFPPLGIVIESIRARLAGMDRERGKCSTCNGNSWIEAWPVMRWGLIYERNQRCPDCGVPAPEVKAQNERPLSKAEYEDYHEKRANRDVMPEWAKPRKPADPAAVNEIREFMDNLRERLFPQHHDRYEP